jgi:hypothetical protein
MHDKFMLPIDAPGPESYLSRDSFCEKEVKREVLKKKPRLLFMLLDMCLKVPDRLETLRPNCKFSTLIMIGLSVVLCLSLKKCSFNVTLLVH